MMSRVPPNLAKCIPESILQEKCRKTERTEYKQKMESMQSLYTAVSETEHAVNRECIEHGEYE